MAIRNLFLLPVVLSLLLVDITADGSIEGNVVSSDSSESLLMAEVGQLKSRISVLESAVEDKARELLSKDESIARLEKIIQEKSEAIAVLQNDVESRQKGTDETEELVKKAHARAEELEKQVKKLNGEIEVQNRRRDALESQARSSKKKIRQLNSKIEELQKTNKEQRTQILKTKRDLQVAEEEMMIAQLEATSKSKELIEKRWIPALKEKWMMMITFSDSYVQVATVKTIGFYKSSMTTLIPYFVKVQELANPYFEVAKRLSKSCVDQIAIVVNPHVRRVQVALKPYIKKAVRLASENHHQVQRTIYEILRKNEVTKPLATREFVWFMSTGMMVLPILLLYKLCLAIFWKKERKLRKNTHSNHVPRKHKRRHVDK